ncbi:MAG: ATP-binding protein [Rhodospirillaceae bacterium]
MAARTGQGATNGGAAIGERLGLGRMVTLAGFFLTAVLVLVTAFDLTLDYLATLRTAGQTARNLTRVLAAQTEAAVSTIDQSLQRVLDAVRDRPMAELARDAALPKMLEEMTRHVPFMSALYVFNAQGEIVVTSRAQLAKPFTAADREYFTVHRDRAEADLFIGPPLINRATGTWSLTLSRRINGPDGHFAGVVMGGLDPYYLQKLYDAIDIGRFGIVSLMLYDGRMLVRSPFDQQQVGLSLANAPVFKAMRDSGRRAGTDRGLYISDGRIRIGAFELVEPGPLVIRVALDEDEVLTVWRQTAALYAAAAAAFVGLMALMIRLLGKQLRRRERAEQASRESGRLSAATIDALTALLCVLDENGTIIVANRAWRAAAGTVGLPGPAVGIGANYLAICETALGGEIFAARSFASGIRAVMAGERSEHVQEYPTRSAEGREWFVGRVTRFAGGGPMRVVVVHQSVTQRRQIEDSLRESERRLAKAQAIAHLGNWEEDLRVGTVWWSEEVYRIFARPPGDFAAGAISYLQFVHPEDRQALNDQELRLISGDEPINLDHRVLRPDGSIRFVNLQAELVRDSEGRPVRTIGIIHDITERKQAEAELRAAVQQAVIANRTKTEFLANMSHELNTPLNAVIGFSELIAEDICCGGSEDKDKVREFGRIILRSGRHLQTLIADILDLTKIDAGQTALEEEPLEVGPLVRERMQQLEAVAEAGGITLLASNLDQQYGLVADRRMLKQILRNLLSNALKFTPAGGAVGVTAMMGEAGRFGLVIEDTGVGMAPEDIPRALDRFSQIDGSLTRCHDGAGLGLALTKLLVEKHGGSIEITSAPRQGTTVAVWFPAHRAFVFGADHEPALICSDFAL